jgi:hypothetical protein
MAVFKDGHERKLIKYTLEASSFGGGDGIHPTLLPCPFYKIEALLSAKEYAEFAELPPTVFKVSFKLA